MVSRWLVAAALATVVGGCTVGSSSPCEEAALEQLSSCSADQRQAFVAACEESGGGDPASLGDDAAAACTTPIADGNADVQTSAEVGLCVAAMYGVKWGVTALSPTPQPLSLETKAALRPLYGALVDQARVSIGASLPPRVVIAGHRLSVQPDAMTFGTQMFMLQEVADDKARPNRLLLTTVHELTHVKQAQAAGGFYGFAQSYCRDMVASGFDYDHIGMEVAAYGVQGQAKSAMAKCGKVVCP